MFQVYKEKNNNKYEGRTKKKAKDKMRRKRKRNSQLMSRPFLHPFPFYFLRDFGEGSEPNLTLKGYHRFRE